MASRRREESVAAARSSSPGTKLSTRNVRPAPPNTPRPYASQPRSRVSGNPTRCLRVGDVERPLGDLACELGSGAQAQLSVDAREMHLAGSDRSEQLCRGLAVRPAGRDESRHTALGARQLSVSP